MLELDQMQCLGLTLVLLIFTLSAASAAVWLWRKFFCSCQVNRPAQEEILLPKDWSLLGVWYTQCQCGRKWIDRHSFGKLVDCETGKSPSFEPSDRVRIQVLDIGGGEVPRAGSR